MTTTITLGPKADLCYGRTGSTKTSQVGNLSEYIWEKFGKRTRLVSASPGGWKPIEHLVVAEDNPDGFIEAQHLSLMTPFPLETITRYCQGWWPDKTGKLAKSDLSNIGAYAFEGMSDFATLVMSNLLGRTDISIPGTPKESFVQDRGSAEGMRWGFSGMAHYGFIQQRVYEMVTTSNHLPVNKVLWTAYDTDAKDSNKRQIYGPMIIGEAMTAQAGGWFGAMLHMTLVPQSVVVADPVDPKKQITVIRRVPIMFLREHVDPDDPYKVPFTAKPRGPSSKWQQWPDFMPPNIGDFYRKLDKMSEEALSEMRAKVAQKGTK
jgi:hypothetical protein